jgi:hypothetical protein
MHILWIVDTFHGHLRSRLGLKLIFIFISFIFFILSSIFPAIFAALTSVVVLHCSKMLPLHSTEFHENSLFFSLSTTLIFSLNFNLTFSLLFFKLHKNSTQQTMILIISTTSSRRSFSLLHSLSFRSYHSFLLYTLYSPTSDHFIFHSSSKLLCVLLFVFYLIQPPS